MEQLDNLVETRADAARVLRISLRKLDYLIAGKQIKTITIGSRRVIPRKSLEEFVRRNAQ